MPSNLARTGGCLGQPSAEYDCSTIGVLHRRPVDAGRPKAEGIEENQLLGRLAVVLPAGRHDVCKCQSYQPFKTRVHLERRRKGDIPTPVEKSKGVPRLTRDHYASDIGRRFVVCRWLVDRQAARVFSDLDLFPSPRAE